jgi:cytochrome c556
VKKLLLLVTLGLALIFGRACAREPTYKPVATIEQIMETTVQPVADAVFDAAVWENGVRVGGPRTDDDWKMVQANAMMLAETGNLLMMGSRAKDQTGWMIRSQAMIDAALLASKAAEAKDVDAIFNAGGRIHLSCTGCHQQYIAADVLTQKK